MASNDNGSNRPGPSSPVKQQRGYVDSFYNYMSGGKLDKLEFEKEQMRVQVDSSSKQLSQMQQEQQLSQTSNQISQTGSSVGFVAATASKANEAIYQQQLAKLYPQFQKSAKPSQKMLNFSNVMNKASVVPGLFDIFATGYQGDKQGTIGAMIQTGGTFALTKAKTPRQMLFSAGLHFFGTAVRSIPNPFNKEKP